MSELSITKKRENEKLTLFAEGRVDTSTSDLLATEAKADLDDITDLEINVENLKYISSSGLRVLMSLNKIMTGKGGKLTVVKPTKMVAEVFDVTGFSNVLNIVK